jgi:hypothetical protein
MEKDLVGKKVLKIFMNSEYLRFETDGGVFTYETCGECCSSTYFYDFYGVKNLLGSVITAVDDVPLELQDYIKRGYKEEEVDEFYGVQLTTVSPEFGEVTSVFSYRNVSNGYYGGSISLSTYTGSLPEIQEDVVETK